MKPVQVDLEDYPGVRREEARVDPFAEIPRRHFNVILADPPWTFQVFSAKGEGRSAKQHYQTMTLDDICAMPVADFAARDCHLFLWLPGSALPHGLRVMEAWGFKYSATGFVWVKTRADGQPAIGMGHTTRKSAEFCLLGRRGSPRRLSKAVREVIMSPRREHSRKPDETYARIEAYAVGPYLELFARTQRPGWTAWGNQVDRFDQPGSSPPLPVVPVDAAAGRPDLSRRPALDGHAETSGPPGSQRFDDGAPPAPALPTQPEAPG